MGFSLLCDEHFDFAVCPHLRAVGHDVLHVKQLTVSKYGDGWEDEHIFTLARDLKRIIVTDNWRHFKSLAHRYQFHNGIVACQHFEDAAFKAKVIDDLLRSRFRFQTPAHNPAPAPSVRTVPGYSIPVGHLPNWTRVALTLRRANESGMPGVDRSASLDSFGPPPKLESGRDRLAREQGCDLQRSALKECLRRRVQAITLRRPSHEERRRPASLVLKQLGAF